MIRERDVVLVYQGTKQRIGVVMRVFAEEGRAMVLAGTSTQRVNEPSVEVECNSQAGKVLGLSSATTYFRRNGFARPRLDEIKPRGGPCPPDLFIALQRLVGLTVPLAAPLKVDSSAKPSVAPQPYSPLGMVSKRIFHTLPHVRTGNTNTQGGVAVVLSQEALLESEILRDTLAAAANQALTQRKVSEAKHTVGAIVSSIAAYVEREDAQGRRRAGGFPPSAPPTPPVIPRGTYFVPDKATWSHPTWQAVLFAVTSPVYFSYEIETSENRRSTIVRAQGDLTGDGRLVIFERALELNENDDILVEVEVSTTHAFRNE